MTAARGVEGQPGFTKPPMLGVRISVWRTVLIALLAAAWVVAAWGRLHPAAVAAPPVVLVVIAFTTIYHVSLTRWVLRWWSWWRHRRDAAVLPSDGIARDVSVGTDIGVISENETLVTMVALEPDPLAPSVVVENEERTINTVGISRLAEMLNVTDVKLSSIDVITVGHRAAGRFGDLYQQMVGPVPAATDRRTWIVLRIGMADNLAAIARRGPQEDAGRRMAAAVCLRVADALASDGIDARPATAAEMTAANVKLHAEAPIADRWSYLEGLSGFSGVYYADPSHIRDDAAQWWTWPAARDVSTLVRLSRTNAGAQIAALVRYRTTARHPAPPVSRLGPLYGVQQAMWRQFRVGFVPTLAPIPQAPLAEREAAIAFGPTGPMIGAIGGPRDKAAAHLPLVGAITVLCQTPLLLRQLALRATATGRPLIAVTDDPQQWAPIVANSALGQVVDAVPEEVPDDAILVIDGQCPLVLPEVTVLTNDSDRPADIELVDADEQYEFTLNTRMGLSARVRSVPTHEERRLLGVTVSPSAPRPARRQVAEPVFGNGLPTKVPPPAPAPTPPAPVPLPLPLPLPPPAPAAPRPAAQRRPAAGPNGAGDPDHYRVPFARTMRGRVQRENGGPPREQDLRGRRTSAPPPPPAGPVPPTTEDSRWRKG
jgi:type VII secretion protein EccE